jgi:hypothetical protein
MTALERIAANLRAILAAHVALQFVDRCRLWSADHIEGHCLMRVAAETANLKIEIPGIERVTQGWRWLRWTLVAKHTLVPGFAGQSVRFLPRLFRAFGRCADRTPTDLFARFGAHGEHQSAAPDVAQMAPRLEFGQGPLYRGSWVLISRRNAAREIRGTGSEAAGYWGLARRAHYGAVVGGWPDSQFGLTSKIKG